MTGDGTAATGEQEAGRTATLHYIHDPLCGWCYGAQPMVEAVQQLASSAIALQLHGGGLFHGSTLTASTRQHIRESDQRIARITGQKFGAPYFDGLLSDPETCYDSAAAIAAILAAQGLDADAGPPMLRGLQVAHYHEGLRVSEGRVLAGIAESIGLDPDRFQAALSSQSPESVVKHIAATRHRMHVSGATGFPTFFLESAGRTVRIGHEPHYGAPGEFADAVRIAWEQF